MSANTLPLFPYVIVHGTVAVQRGMGMSHTLIAANLFRETVGIYMYLHTTAARC